MEYLMITTLVNVDDEDEVSICTYKCKSKMFASKLFTFAVNDYLEHVERWNADICVIDVNTMETVLNFKHVR